MDNFTSTLESMFECWKYIELCNLINERENQKEKTTNTNKQDNKQSTRTDYNNVLSQLPKNFRIKFFNNTGKQMRLSANSPTDHLPVTGNKSRCVLCQCSTTVTCGTCTVNICKNAFGNNELSCFEKFHQQETLVMKKREGDTFRKMPTVEGSVKKVGTKKIVKKSVKKTIHHILQQDQHLQRDSKTTTTIKPT